MRIRNLILCLFVAMFAVAAWTERASAQCWNCKPNACMWRDWGRGCVMGFPKAAGYNDCIDYPVGNVCRCDTPEAPGSCVPPQDEDLDVAAAKLESELLETVLAIRAGESIPADGSFVYVSRGPDLVVRRRCDLAEFARVAIVVVEPARTLAGG